MKSLRQKIIVIIFSVLYVAFLAYMIYQSLSSAESSDEQSGMVSGFLSQLGIFTKMQQDGTLDGFVRKFIGHYLEFAVLGAFGYMVFSNAVDNEYSFLINCGAGLVSCVIVELSQNFAAGRSASFFDITLDYQGYLTAISVLTIIVLIICLIRKQDPSITIKNFSFSMPAYILAIVPFSFYSGNQFGSFVAFFTFLSAFLVCTLTAAIIYLVKRKTASKKKSKRRK